MIGVYTIDESRINEMKSAGRFMVVKMFLTIYALFIIAILLSKDEDKLTSAVISTVVIAVLFLIFIIITFFVKSPVYNTVIEVTDQGLVRTGHELLTVRLKFNEIDKMIPKGNGTILIRKGLNSRFSLYFSKQAYINEYDILFIPLAMDNYEKLLRYIEQKIE